MMQVETCNVVAVETSGRFDCHLNLRINSRQPPLKMVAASICIPKEDPAYPRGDDAHFISADKQSIGVADGVGGWRHYGIDSGEYARQLMSLVEETIKNNVKKIRPKRALEEAYGKTTAQGSSTACVVSFSGEDRVLRAANVGDSGFLVVRKGAVWYRSPRQQRSFSCPYQLGPTKDDPSVAEEIEFPVKRGDLVVLGTDGVLDNVHEAEMLEILGRGALLGFDLAEQCCIIANIALNNSFDRHNDTPYSIAARRAGKHHRPGGKVDDITLVIARIE